jgi:hypothetical protein
MAHRADFCRSLKNPHPETAELAEAGLESWVRSLPDEDTETLLDRAAAKPIQWIPGEGWVMTKV